jgi:hypothetical protein
MVGACFRTGTGMDGMRRLLAAALFVLTLVPPAAGAQVDPPPVRIGILQASDAWSHRLAVDGFLHGMAESGWRDRIVVPDGARITLDAPLTPDTMQAAARRLTSRVDLDLILSLAEDGGAPVLALDVVNPGQAGLVGGERHRNRANFAVLQLTRQWNDMFHLFHEVVNIRRLGAMVAEHENGPIVTKLREVARDGGFQLELYRGMDGAPDACETALRSLLATHIDAFVIPSLGCFDPDTPGSAALLEALADRRVATLAFEGTPLVRHGALLGPSATAAERAGAKAAQMAISILGGAPPGSLETEMTFAPSVAVNLATAARLGIDVPMDLLLAVDQVFLSRGMQPKTDDRGAAAPSHPRALATATAHSGL